MVRVQNVLPFPIGFSEVLRGLQERDLAETLARVLVPEVCRNNKIAVQPFKIQIQPRRTVSKESLLTQINGLLDRGKAIVLLPMLTWIE